MVAYTSDLFDSSMVSFRTFSLSLPFRQTTTRDEDIDVESGEYVPVGHIWKFDLKLNV